MKKHPQRPDGQLGRYLALSAAALTVSACSSSPASSSTASSAVHDGGAGPDGSSSSAADGSTEDAPASSDAPASGTDANPLARCAPSWSVTACSGGSTSTGAAPDFGPNVFIFDTSMSNAAIQSQLTMIYAKQDSAQFGTGRYAYFFKPGQYSLDVKLGFYMQALGLGQSPDDVVITGAVRAKADWTANANATTNFWRGAENLAVTPGSNIDNNVDIWAVSQGTELRRVHVKGTMHLDDGGWSSGGFIADSLIDGQIVSGTQQQFVTRNDDQSWTGSNWNMVFVGNGTPPSGSWPHPPYSIEATTPRVREKPFLYLDAAGHYAVMVPSLKVNSTGHSWASGAPPGLRSPSTASTSRSRRPTRRPP